MLMRRAVLTMTLAPAIACGTGPAASELDLSRAEDNLIAYIKMRGSLDGSDVVTWWYGQIHAALPNRRPRLLFGLEGTNVARFERQQDGSWRMYSREYAVYTDPETGAILQHWVNPWTNRTVAVLQVQNDPVNHVLAAPDGEQGRLLPMRQVGDDVILGLDLALAYPNPIQPDAWPKDSSGPLYVASEHFGFYARKAELDDPDRPSTPISIAWFRHAPWLPWMQMGGRPGTLVYSGYGKKLPGGVDELPALLRSHIAEHAPEYLSAPQDWQQPNATSWTVYKQLVLEAVEDSEQVPAE